MKGCERLSIKRWQLSENNKSIVESLMKNSEGSEISGFSYITASLLCARGINTCEEALKFISASYEYGDPFLYKDMKKAADIIKKAIEDNQKIAVYGDYDADGITATALLYSHLKYMGANVIYYIPLREGEGYGLHEQALNSLKEQGVKLVVTVDNGISAVSEVAYASSIGLDIIITDHHLPSDTLPQALAVVDPYQSDCQGQYKTLAGVGVAFKLACALCDGDHSYALAHYADLTALGTLADVMPLTGENRMLVKAGQELMVSNARIGIKEMLKASKTSDAAIEASMLSYSVIPRINAAGRIGTPYTALELLITNDGETAKTLAEQLNELNRERQSIEQTIIREADEILEKNPQMLYDRVLVLAHDNWHVGIIGIVASRILEKYGRPVIMVSIDGEDAKGSSRSFSGFSIHDALKSCSKHLEYFGGHKLAAGLKIKTENIDAFRKSINEYASGEFDEMPVPSINIDLILECGDISIKTQGELSRLEPFGTSNNIPVFMSQNLKIKSLSPVGQGKHLKIFLNKNEDIVNAIKFNLPIEEFSFKEGELVDIVFTLDKSFFKGQTYLSVIIKDIRASGLDGQKLIHEYFIYNELMRTGKANSGLLEITVPTRDDIALVYRFLRNAKVFKHDFETLYYRIGQNSISYCKMRLAIDVLLELKLIDIQKKGDNILIKVLDSAQKTTLEHSAILSALKA